MHINFPAMQKSRYPASIGPLGGSENSDPGLLTGMKSSTSGVSLSMIRSVSNGGGGVFVKEQNGINQSPITSIYCSRF